MNHILKIDPARPDLDALRAAAEAIRDGGVIAYPTETVYGLGVDPLQEGGVRRVFGLKGREAEKALILLIRGGQDLAVVASGVTEAARRLMEAFWPGPLTLALKASPGLPEALLGGGETVAVRVSSHPVARALTDLVGGPITSTSANRSGQPPARSALEVGAIFGEEIDLIVDGGPSAEDRPSTVVDVSGPLPILLREGKIGVETIEAVVGRVLR
ncbi:MAG: threonylcarbamoyl-AMP synthase [Candidatus Handelsmanbacteria bacterium RIFCSPLOWO2_12_FULL_64_10]|uniref:L-threonylcarbamoyladenylate synthase n=1 Tax=Handelsmanbacteria sp. (strain RIFCSPLOWO2_12_FULL_64_10) TaxID=1817868 RepID=A0A1F6CQV9_HANXR|nr:MAG: threonylcarbamoyl-AMP synthase [Candidatus Handelsmanbacteria bacterium RIFCSPLOWO2_12_FULL_64_10]